MLLHILSEQNVVVNFLYRILVLSLTTFELIDVLVVHLDLSVCHRLLPVGKSSEFLVPVDPILCSVQKLLCKFEPSDEHKPRAPTVFRCRTLSLLFKPLTLLVNKLFPLFCITLRFEL